MLQLIANNKLDAHSRTLLTSSNLFGLRKPDGSLRPIAVGEVFLKLAARYCYSLASPSFPSIFEPIQMAVGTPGGVERVTRWPRQPSKPIRTALPST